MKKWKIDEPVEIIIESASYGIETLLATNVNGVVRALLQVRGRGQAHCLTNLQSTGTFPGKAVEGWQDEVIAFARLGLGTVTSFR